MRRGETVALFSSVPRQIVLGAGIGTWTRACLPHRLPWFHRASPSTTLNETVISTDPDKMMCRGFSVKHKDCLGEVSGVGKRGRVSGGGRRVVCCSFWELVGTVVPENVEGTAASRSICPWRV